MTRREYLTFQENDPDPIAVTSLTRTSTTATVTTATPHGYTSTDYVTITGAVPTGFNGKVKITVSGPSTFTYPVVGTLATPATGTVSVVYTSDAQGGRAIGWSTLLTEYAELLQVRAMEQLQAKAISLRLDYRFRIPIRREITARLRILWTPRWPMGATQKILEVHGVQPEGDGRENLILDCGEVV